MTLNLEELGNTHVFFSCVLYVENDASQRQVDTQLLFFQKLAIGYYTIIVIFKTLKNLPL